MGGFRDDSTPDGGERRRNSKGRVEPACLPLRVDRGFIIPNSELTRDSGPGIRLADTEATNAMKYQRFEDLPVWQTAIELGQQVYTLTEDAAFKRRHSLCDQIERAAVFVSSNSGRFREGHQSGTADVSLHCPRLGGRSPSMPCLLEGMPPFRNLESGIRDLRTKTESISKRLGARSLQDSDSKGRRYVNEKVRRQAQAQHQRDEFLKELEHMRAGPKPRVADWERIRNPRIVRNSG
jgi:hypothetical protein